MTSSEPDKHEKSQTDNADDLGEGNVPIKSGVFQVTTILVRF